MSGRHLRGLIFDVDGTLAETEELHRQCFNAAFESAGLGDHWDRERYAELLHTPGGRERLARHFRESRRPLDAAAIAALHRDKNARYAERLALSPPALRPGIAGLLDSASRTGLALGIATTTSLDNLEALMRGHFGAGWRARFAAVVCGESVQHKKPHPQAYQLALQQMRLGPAQALAFEDSGPGVAAARAAGLAVVATPSQYFKDDDLRAATLCLDHLGLFPSGDTGPPEVPQLADWFERLSGEHA